MLPEFGAFSRAGWLVALMATGPLGLLTNPDGRRLEPFFGGTARGPIVGGNLFLVTATMGTPHEIDARGTASPPSASRSALKRCWTPMPARWSSSRARHDEGWAFELLATQ